MIPPDEVDFTKNGFASEVGREVVDARNRVSVGTGNGRASGEYITTTINSRSNM